MENELENPAVDAEERTTFESAQPQIIYESDPEPRPGEERISGWLTLFLVLGVGISSLAGLAMGLFEVGYDDLGWCAEGRIAYAAYVLTLVANVGLAGFTIYAFYARRPYAVFLAKAYVVANFVEGLLTFMVLGAFLENNDVTDLGRSLLWSVVWFSYLCMSSQVNELIPADYRRTPVSAIAAIGLLIFLPMAIFFGLSYRMVNNPESIAASVMAERGEVVIPDLAANQATDSCVVYTIPEDLGFIHQEVDGYTFFNVIDREGNTITLVSDVQLVPADMEVFNEYVTSFTADDVANMSSTIVSNNVYEQNGLEYYHRTRRFTSIGTAEVYYHDFYMVYSAARRSIAIISSYGLNSEFPVNASIADELEFL